jgi:hypothetical protein
MILSRCRFSAITTPTDYQSFASENGEQLAQAIQRGIPDTLRGMMWQLMYAFTIDTPVNQSRG